VRKGVLELDDEGLALGTVVSGKYRLEAVLGGGGMGLVLAARHLQLDERVAIKFLRRDLARDVELSRRFLREGQAAVRLKSEHVARVLDVGQRETGTPYLVMEMLEGQDLDQMLVDAQRLPSGQVIDFVLQSCVALAEAHAIGIVHRDLKPSNFFVTWRADGSPLLKLLDFGISKVPADVDLKLTGTQSVLGTPAYMSPEQMRSARMADPRSDIWSLGAVCYELICGHRPFEAESFSELCVKVALDPPLPVDAPVPVGLEGVIQRCLEKQPEQRFQSVAELAMALQPFAADTRAGAWMVERTQRIVHRASTSSSQTGRNAGQPVAAAHAEVAPAGSGAAAEGAAVRSGADLGAAAVRPGADLGAAAVRPGADLGAGAGWRPGSDLGAGTESGAGRPSSHGAPAGGWGAGSGPVPQRPAWAQPAMERSRRGEGGFTPSGQIPLPPVTPSGQRPVTPSGQMGLPPDTRLPPMTLSGNEATMAASSGPISLPKVAVAASIGMPAVATPLRSVATERPRRRWLLVAVIAAAALVGGIAALALRQGATREAEAPSGTPDSNGAVVRSLAPDAAVAPDAGGAVEVAQPGAATPTGATPAGATPEAGNARAGATGAGAAAGVGATGAGAAAGATGAGTAAGATGATGAKAAGAVGASGGASGASSGAAGAKGPGRFRAPGAGTEKAGGASSRGRRGRTGTAGSATSQSPPRTGGESSGESDGETGKDDDIFGKRK
jgi:eukaryotic-like serine/threonine-protein kinase